MLDIAAILSATRLFDKAGLTDSLVSTAKVALKQLFDAGQVHRIGKGIKRDPYLYFVGGK